MTGRELYIFVEGPDDKRFVERVVKPLLGRTYSCVRPRQYSNERREKLMRLFDGIEKSGDDCIVMGDYDRGPCIPAAKNRIQRRTGAGPPANIVVVVRAIEGWYLAGLDQQSANELGIKKLPQATNGVTKRKFNRLIHRKYDSRVDFMMDVLRYFSLEVATTRNASFAYFIGKYCS